MKTFYLLIFFIWSLSVCGQEKLTYTEVVKVDSVSKTELFQRARAWFNTAFISSQNVLNIQDKESGELGGSAVIPYESGVYVGSAGTRGRIRFTLSVTAKDGRYKYEFTNFSHTGTATSLTKPYDFGLITQDETCPYHLPGGTESWNTKVWKDIKKTIDRDIQPLIVDLKSKMNVPVVKKDW